MIIVIVKKKYYAGKSRGVLLVMEWKKGIYCWAKIIVLMLFSSTEIYASQPLKTFCIGYGNIQTKSIHLRWFVNPNNPIPKEGYTILRKKHGAPMIFQVVGTVSPSTYSLALKNNKDEQQIVDSVITLSERISRSNTPDPLHIWSLQYLNCIVPGTVSEILGLQFMDTTVRQNIMYDYRIDIGTTTIATVTKISTAFQLNPTVQGLKIEQTNSGVKLYCDVNEAYSQGITRWKIVRQIDNSSDTVAIVPKVLINDLKSGLLYFDLYRFNKGERITYSIIPFDLWNNRGKSTNISLLIKGNSVKLDAPVFTDFTSKAGKITLTWNVQSSKNIERFRIYRTIKDNKELINTQFPSSIRNYTDTMRQPIAINVVYQILSVDSLGREGDLSLPLSVPIDDTIPPSRPKYVIAQIMNRTFELLWNRSDDIDMNGYEIARSLASEKTFKILTAAPIKDSVFRDTSLLSAKSGIYVYKIRAVDIFGNRSDWTDPTTIALPDISIPSSPIITDIKGTDKSVELRWQKVSEFDLAGYWVNRTDDTLFTPITLNDDLLPRERTFYSDSAVKAGVLYYYEIVSVDSTLNISAPSLRLSGRSYDTRQPIPPIIDSLYSSNGQIVITWFYEFPPPITVTTVIERSRDGKRFVQISAPLNEKETRFSDNDIRSGEEYYYRVRAISYEGSIGKPSENKLCVAK